MSRVAVKGFHSPGAPRNLGRGEESRAQQSSGCRGSVQVPVKCIRKGTHTHTIGNFELLLW